MQSGFDWLSNPSEKSCSEDSGGAGPFSDVLHNNQTDYSLNETLVWRNYFPRPFQLVAVCVQILFLKLQSAAPNDLAIFSLKATIVLFIWDFK